MGLTKLGKQVRKRLIELEQTQTSLAYQLNVSHQHLSGMLHGRSALELEERVREWLKKTDVQVVLNDDTRIET